MQQSMTTDVPYSEKEKKERKKDKQMRSDFRAPQRPSTGKESGR
jgi:hypothetical protein